MAIQKKATLFLNAVKT